MDQRALRSPAAACSGLLDDRRRARSTTGGCRGAGMSGIRRRSGALGAQVEEREELGQLD
jgi:hypothetical protein